MIIDKKQLEQYIHEAKISFTPALDSFQLQPNSIDLRIGWSFYVPESSQYTDRGRTAADPDYLQMGVEHDHIKLIKLKPGQYFEILPHELVIASSLEKIEINAGNVMAMLCPRSTMVRRGFVIQSGLVNVRYRGHLTIPILNATNHKLKLYPGERAYQLLFYKLENDYSEEEIKNISGAKYTDTTAVNLEARRDTDKEIEFIKKGNIDELKKEFPVN